MNLAHELSTAVPFLENFLLQMLGSCCVRPSLCLDQPLWRIRIQKNVSRIWSVRFCWAWGLHLQTSSRHFSVLCHVPLGSCHTRWHHHLCSRYPVGHEVGHWWYFGKFHWRQNLVECIDGDSVSTETFVRHNVASSKGIWWYPAFKSSFENTVAPFRFVGLGCLGLGCLSLRMALFGILMSTTLPIFFGIMTRGETHVVGPSTFSIIPVLLKPVFGCEMGCAGLTERPERLCRQCVIESVCSWVCRSLWKLWGIVHRRFVVRSLGWRWYWWGRG